jgi:hypothetical protein
VSIENQTYTAALVSQNRIGAGEMVPMTVPDTGTPPRFLTREHEADGIRYRTTWEQWGDPDGNIHSYSWVSVEPI